MESLNKKKLPAFVFLLFLLLGPALSAEPLYSPSWGFRIDLPEGYQYAEGNSYDRYSFHGPGGAKFDIAVYDGVYGDVVQMAEDIIQRLDNTGDAAFFEYGSKETILLELNFHDSAGWGLCLELAGENVLLLALAYAPADRRGMDIYHLSALDSIIPSEAQRLKPGPITEFSYPRGQQKSIAIVGTELTGTFFENDAEAAQALVDREFALLARYQFSLSWQEAWTRFYRAIYRDSWDRIENAVFLLERHFYTCGNKRTFAEKALAWVQGFQYERDLEGSDFINLVTALTEGRGDCDSRAMLWAIVLRQAGIPSAIMVSRNHSHAMGLTDVSGSGARFEAYGINWLVAETTSSVALGLIDQGMSDQESWLAVIFE